MFIERMKENFKMTTPIFSREILTLFKDYSTAYVFRMIKKAEESGELVKFSTGVYFMPEPTFFGQTTITADKVVERRYIRDGNEVFGVYSGIRLLNFFDATTQLPMTLEIVSNNETMRRREISFNRCRFILRKSRCQITADNANAYMVLQFFNDMKMKSELSKWSKRRLTEFIQKNNISAQSLIELAKYFPAQTTKNLIYSEVLNATA